MKSPRLLPLLAAFLSSSISLSAHALSISGTVLDATTQRGLEGAFVTLGAASTRTDAQGLFHIEGDGSELRARAWGHGRTTLKVADAGIPAVLALEPITPKGIYLSAYGISSLQLRGAALALIEDTQLNTLVIDVKTDSALVSHQSTVPLAREIGAQRLILKKDLPETIANLHAKGIYTIARIVVFKDTLLAQARPEWAVRGAGGSLWRDREGLSWVDPFRREVWEYNIALAKEAALMGFDEIQFDYVRFPDTRGLVFSQPNTEENRVGAINGFLSAARKQLEPHNVFLSADVFGYIAWNRNDTDIGQRINDILQYVDYASPMLYPSGFQNGIPGVRDPVANAHDIVYRSLARARERADVPAVRFRPWLQAFRDYAFDRRVFGAVEIQQQISAAERFGASGWLLWNPRNVYRADHIDVPPLTAER